MKRFTYCITTVLVLLALGMNKGRAQQKIDSMINVYGENFPQEKVHVHFDKAVYNPGETIWFKAYIFSGFLPSGISKNFYVELIDPATGRIIQRKTLPVFEATTANYFDLPLSFNLSEVVFRAYTTWMMNFDSSFLYTKTITIVNSKTAVNTAPPAKTVSLGFFPEGGDLVAGLATVVAFKATDAQGYPEKIKGVVKNDKGVKVADFSSVHDGMGRFDLEPVAGATYTAEWTDARGGTGKTNLPAVKDRGGVLQLMGFGDKKSFIVKRSVEASPELTKLYVVAHMHQQVVYKATIDLSSNFMTSGVIPVNNLPSGMLQVTLFDSSWKPLAERVTFIHNDDFVFTPNVVTLGANLKRRAKNIITVEIPDTMRTNLSLAITDAGVGDEGHENIMSRLLLAGDLKGYIHNSAYYLSSSSDSVQQHTDLVMMTHGWRRFKWDDLAAGKLPKIKYPLENYLGLKGELLGLQPSQIPQNTSVNVFMEAKDSSRQIFSLEIDRNGKFGEDGLIFFDTVKLYYQFNKNQSLTSRAVVNFNNGSLRVPSLVNFNPAWKIYNPLDSAALNRARFIAMEGDRIRPEQERKAKMLDAVTVTARARTKVQQMDDKYARGLFSGGDAYSFDLTDDPFAMGARDIFTYLQSRVPGLQISQSGGANGPSLSWRQATPTLYLDEMQVDASMLQGISVNDIAYVKAFRPPFFGAPGGGSGGAIAVYTKRGGDVGKNDSPIPGGMEKNRLIGYAAPRQFYSPDYSEPALNDVDDVRTTLYWSPYLLMDKNTRKSTIIFYNNDVTRKMKLVLEGYNEEGRLTRVEKILE
ncbi:MAG: hypothetical protein P0Y53_08940 [Candidatus Pseudobacter hemicellulosilyticus]|uniref:TonB-dependent receptor plug domain-containing protein n=1 Tax=Candidatus Pseudobacter hemicellulosilyticus TaxID=3121375 RepID=A0AAJ6BIT5_9BACT|nr:MAG: hypothetical protein P0Y53_08940 [Pseudobacter sp.]